MHLIMLVTFLCTVVGFRLNPGLDASLQMKKTKTYVRQNAVENSQLNVFGTIAAGIVSIPGSLLIDKFLQRGTERISKISNTIITDDMGEVYAYIARPTPVNTNEPQVKYPVVVLIHQFFGLRPRDTELCDELARLGYVAVAPDCFQGNTTSLIPRAISLVAPAAFKDDWDSSLRDLGRVIKYLKTDCSAWADTSKVVISGFCFGGGLALRYADTFPEDIKGCAVFYGKPISKLSKLNCNVYGVFGSRDRQFSPEMVDRFELLLKSSNVPVEMRRYEGKAHAFIDDLECIQRGGDAGDAWAGFVDFLERNLS